MPLESHGVDKRGRGSGGGYVRDIAKPNTTLFYSIPAEIVTYVG